MTLRLLPALEPDADARAELATACHFALTRPTWAMECARRALLTGSNQTADRAYALIMALMR